MRASSPSPSPPLGRSRFLPAPLRPRLPGTRAPPPIFAATAPDVARSAALARPAGRVASLARRSDARTRRPLPRPPPPKPASRPTPVPPRDRFPPIFFSCVRGRPPRTRGERLSPFPSCSALPSSRLSGVVADRARARRASRSAPCVPRFLLIARACFFLFFLLHTRTQRGRGRGDGTERGHGRATQVPHVDDKAAGRGKRADGGLWQVVEFW